MKTMVSVVIPNYNHSHFLPRCLDAVFRQTLPPDEVLVIDDASTDRSLEVLQAYARQQPRLRVCSNATNVGVNVTLNRGLEMAAGDYVFFTAADDEVRPRLLERSLAVLAAHPLAGLSTGWSEWRCSATNLNWVAGTQMPSVAGYLSPVEMEALGRRGRLFLCNPSAVYRREALVQAGGWIPELRWHSDWFGAYVVGFRHGICHVPEVLSVFNLSPSSYYHSALSRNERLEPLRVILRLLASPRYGDVTPAIARSGVMGGLGWPMARLIYGDRANRHLRTPAFARAVTRRVVESTGRRILPTRLASLCVRLFVGKPTGSRTGPG